VKIPKFGFKSNRIKARSIKYQKEKDDYSNEYYSYLHNSKQKCIICSNPCINVHHLTDIYRIKGKRRSWDRVVTLCNKHHDNYSKESIHMLNHSVFYETIMSLESLLFHSRRLLEEFENSNKKGKNV